MISLLSFYTFIFISGYLATIRISRSNLGADWISVKHCPPMQYPYLPSCVTHERVPMHTLPTFQIENVTKQHICKTWKWWFIIRQLIKKLFYIVKIYIFYVTCPYKYKHTSFWILFIFRAYFLCILGFFLHIFYCFNCNSSTYNTKWYNS